MADVVGAVAVVTGGQRGLGAAFTRELLARRCAHPGLLGEATPSSKR